MPKGTLMSKSVSTTLLFLSVPVDSRLLASIETDDPDVWIIEFDVVEPFAGGPTDGLNDHFRPGRAGDADIPGEVLQLQGSVLADRDRAIDLFGFLLCRRRPEGLRESGQRGNPMYFIMFA